MTRRATSSGGRCEAAVGHSRAVAPDGWAHVAGATGMDPAAGAIPEEAAAQARAASGIIERALAQAGAGSRMSCG